MNYFTNHPNLYAHLTLFLDQSQGLSSMGEDGTMHKPIDAKDYLKYQIEEMVKMVIAISKVLEESRSGKKPFLNNKEYNDRINEECNRIKNEKLYSREDMVKCYRRFIKEEPGRTTDAIVNEVFMKGPEVLIQMYRKLIADWFTNNGTGKQMLNTIIDYANMDFLISSGEYNWVYMTEEKKIITVLFNTNDIFFDRTRAFYNKFYMG